MSHAADAGTPASDTRKRVRDYLACDDHSNRTAERVCGECGTPLCDDCAKSVPDITLEHYEGGGGRRLFLALGLLLGVPLLLNDLAPTLLGTIMGVFFDEPLYLKGSLVKGSLVVGIASLAAVRYRTRYGFADIEPLAIGDVIGDFELLLRRSGTRTVCDDCRSDKRIQKYLLWGITLVAGLLVVYGLYRSVPNLFFIPLKYTGYGIALYIVRRELVALTVGTLNAGSEDRPD